MGFNQAVFGSAPNFVRCVPNASELFANFSSVTDPVVEPSLFAKMLRGSVELYPVVRYVGAFVAGVHVSKRINKLRPSNLLLKKARNRDGSYSPDRRVGPEGEASRPIDLEKVESVAYPSETGDRNETDVVPSRNAYDVELSDFLTPSAAFGLISVVWNMYYPSAEADMLASLDDRASGFFGLDGGMGVGSYIKTVCSAMALKSLYNTFDKRFLQTEGDFSKNVELTFAAQLSSLGKDGAVGNRKIQPRRDEELEKAFESRAARTDRKDKREREG